MYFLYPTNTYMYIWLRRRLGKPNSHLHIKPKLAPFCGTVTNHKPLTFPIHSNHFWMYFLYPTNKFTWLFINVSLLVEPNGHFSSQLKLVAFSGTGTRYFFIVWFYYVKTYLYANFEAISVFYYEHSSIYSTVTFFWRC